MDHNTICSGCGVSLPSKSLATNEGYNASGECQEHYNTLCGLSFSYFDPSFTHQLAVDAYTAQHAFDESKPIGIVFALIGLCLVNKHDFTGRQVQRFHMNIQKQKWPKLTPPSLKSDITIADISGISDENQRNTMIKKWALEVWETWEIHHDYIITLVDSLFDSKMKSVIFK